MVWKSEAITRGARALRALAVKPRAAEQQQHHQAAEREVVEGLVPHLPHLVRMAQGRLHDQRGVDREEETEQIERGERGYPRDGPSEVEPQQPSEQGLTRPTSRAGSDSGSTS